MIISTGRRNGKTQEMLKQAMKENELLGEALKNARREIAKLKRENASLKADKDKIRADIIKYESDCRLSVDEYPLCKECNDKVFKTIYGILDKYKKESEGQE